MFGRHKLEQSLYKHTQKDTRSTLNKFKDLLQISVTLLPSVNLTLYTFRQKLQSPKIEVNNLTNPYIGVFFFQILNSELDCWVWV